MQLDSDIINNKPKSPFMKPKKELTDTDRNRIKKFERKTREGKLGKFYRWFDFMKDKKELTIKDFNTYKSPFGRIGNRVYKCLINSSYKFLLYRKFKNATKAKKFMESVK